MSNSDATGPAIPQPPRPPGEAQQPSSLQQYQNAPQPGYQPPAAYYAPQQFGPRPGTPGVVPLNALAVAAFAVTAGVAVLGSLLLPIADRLLSRLAMSTYNDTLFLLWERLDLLTMVPLYLVGLSLAIASVKRSRPARGKMLGYIALGAAAAGIVSTMMYSLGTRMSYGIMF